MSKLQFNIGGIVIERESEEVTKAIEDGKEIELSSDEIKVFKATDYDTFVENLERDKYKEGKTAGVEMAVKDAREKHGLDFEGKTMDSFADAFKAKIEADAKIEPDQKLKTLQGDLEAVKSKYSTLEDEYTNFKTTVNEEKLRGKKDAALTNLLPKEGLKVDTDIVLMAVKSKAGLDVGYDENGKMFLTKNGEMLKDDLRNPVEAEPYVLDSLKALDLVSKPKGSSDGDGDDTGGTSETSYEKFVKTMEASGISEGSIEFNEKMQEAIKNKTLKF